MHQVKINIEIKGKITAGLINLPSCWNEVPAAIYPLLAKVYLAEMPDVDRTVTAFMLLAANKNNITGKLIDEEVYDLLHLIDWVFDKMDLKKNLVPQFVIKQTAYLGPDDGLSNMRFGEWVCADTYFTEYSNTKSETALNQLIAAIYRPAGKGPLFKPGNAFYRGDKREKFNDTLVEIRAEIVATLPLYFRQAIALWFASCRWQLKTDYPMVFNPDDNDDADKNPMLAGDGWFGIYDDLRGDPKFGGPDKLEEEYIHTIFQSLTRSHHKIKALKKQYAS